MQTERLRSLVVNAAADLHAAAGVWPNGLGFDTVGADGWTYTVGYDERRSRWIANREHATYGTGLHPWQALANVTTEGRS